MNKRHYSLIGAGTRSELHLRPLFENDWRDLLFSKFRTRSSESTCAEWEKQKQGEPPSGPPPHPTPNTHTHHPASMKGDWMVWCEVYFEWTLVCIRITTSIHTHVFIALLEQYSPSAVRNTLLLIPYIIHCATFAVCILFSILLFWFSVET